MSRVRITIDVDGQGKAEVITETAPAAPAVQSPTVGFQEAEMRGYLHGCSDAWAILAEKVRALTVTKFPDGSYVRFKAVMDLLQQPTTVAPKERTAEPEVPANDAGGGESDGTGD